MSNYRNIKMKNLAILLFIITPIYLFGQSFEIRVNALDGSSFSVDMRCTSVPSPSTSDYLLDIVFGVKWLESYNANLSSTIGGGYQIKKSEVELISGGFEYQAFYADFVPYTFPEDWILNEWITIATLSISQSDVSQMTFEITEPGFDPTCDPNINVNGIDFEPLINGSGTLPIIIQNFDVSKYGYTSSNIDFIWRGFGFNTIGIERSAQNKKWETIVVFNNTNSQENDLNFIDYDVFDGIGTKKFYYRLKVLDFDGQYYYSDIKEITFNSLSNNILSIYPNPTFNQLYFTLSDQTEGPTLQVSILDLEGKLVYTEEILYSGEKNRVKDLNELNLESGVYHLMVEDGQNNRYNKKFVFYR